jgi:hypothetical protein
MSVPEGLLYTHEKEDPYALPLFLSGGHLWRGIFSEIAFFAMNGNLARDMRIF